MINVKLVSFQRKKNETWDVSLRFCSSNCLKLCKQTQVEQWSLFRSNDDFVLSDLDNYTLVDKGCLPGDYVPNNTYQLYVEVTLTGCKYLCERLHDVACSLLVMLPLHRSCYLQPDQRVLLTEDVRGCFNALIYKRHRQTC